MKSQLPPLPLLILIASVRCASAQGTFLYDQQSAFSDTTLGEGSGSITANQPMGQSFTPSFDSVGFIKLQLYGGNNPGGPGTTLFLNLRSGSITGPVLGSTDPVFLANGWLAGYVTFTFASPIQVTPGVQYFFQPVVQAGDWSVGAYNPGYNYAGGTLILRGTPNPASDLLFREGIIVPEPSSAALILLGTGFWFFSRRRSKT
jgi:hypothetical protein